MLETKQFQSGMSTRSKKWDFLHHQNDVRASCTTLFSHLNKSAYEKERIGRTCAQRGSSHSCLVKERYDLGGTMGAKNNYGEWVGRT